MGPKYHHLEMIITITVDRNERDEKVTQEAENERMHLLTFLQVY